ncbi:LCP family protein [Candidatus Gracilibacteria bacterium]|nr:LCP family protein [Candidatus Gracilibacteria bacterium]
MFFKKGNFSSTRIGEIDNYNTNKKKAPFINSVIRFLAIIFSIIAVFYVGKYAISFVQASMGIISKGSIKMISQNIGQDMKKDEFGNVNILLIGYGGESHAGGYLADSIMVASRNPELGAITFISIPRDLRVKNPNTNGYSRINVLFNRIYNRNKDLIQAASGFSEKIEEIVGLDINYYATIDFNGFEKVIDTLGGVDIYIKNTIHDTTYPDGEKGYMTFHLDAGQQHLDGKTALMYARSRHTTSDFDRSLRQQQIINSIKDKLLSGGNIKSVSKIKELYGDYTQMVNTNINFKEIVGVVKYIDNIKQIFSFGLNTNCVYTNFEYMTPGCFLYNPNRELFDGAAVIIPNGGTPGNVSFYDHIHKFSFLVTHNQEYLLEGADIIIQNGIDKNFARSIGKRIDGNSNLLAAKLKKYGLKISDTQNATSPIEKTTIYIPYTGAFQGTTKILGLFFDAQIINSNIGTGNELTIILGNDYIQKIKENGFRYDL